jgi:hypothetical protein
VFARKPGKPAYDCLGGQAAPFRLHTCRFLHARA